MRIVVAFGLSGLVSLTALAQGNGIGGVLVRDVPIPNDKGEWPTVLPAGGLVAFGFGRDWSASHREDGEVLVNFIVREEDGDLDRGLKGYQRMRFESLHGRAASRSRIVWARNPYCVVLLFGQSTHGQMSGNYGLCQKQESSPRN